MVTSQPDLVSPAPSWDLNDFTAEAANRNVLGMDAMYANPFTVNDMQMDLGPYSDTFNWVSMIPNANEQGLIGFRMRSRPMASCIRTSNSHSHLSNDALRTVLGKLQDRKRRYIV